MAPLGVAPQSRPGLMPSFGPEKAPIIGLEMGALGLGLTRGLGLRTAFEAVF